jgi:hypothetical protein
MTRQGLYVLVRTSYTKVHTFEPAFINLLAQSETGGIDLHNLGVGRTYDRNTGPAHDSVDKPTYQTMAETDSCYSDLLSSGLRSVRFGAVEIREHPMILGDHPGVKKGEHGLLLDV